MKNDNSARSHINCNTIPMQPTPISKSTKQGSSNGQTGRHIAGRAVSDFTLSVKLGVENLPKTNYSQIHRVMLYFVFLK